MDDYFDNLPSQRDAVPDRDEEPPPDDTGEDLWQGPWPLPRWGGAQ